MYPDREKPTESIYSKFKILYILPPALQAAFPLAKEKSCLHKEFIQIAISALD